MASHRKAIDVRIDGAAATIELNRPDQLNAWDLELGTELHEAVKSLAADEAVRAVMITGAGRAFSDGRRASRRNAAATTACPDLGERLKSLYNPIIVEIREMPKPVVAAVNGPAVGVGCALALACDLIVAAESAYFLLAFVKLHESEQEVRGARRRRSGSGRGRGRIRPERRDPSPPPPPASASRGSRR